jgi:hypothetical protein
VLLKAYRGGALACRSYKPPSRLAYLPTLLNFLLPAVVDVALAAALDGEPPHRTPVARLPRRPLTLPIDLPAPPPQWGEGGDSIKAQVPATDG